jgi:hypothetical protein
VTPLERRVFRVVAAAWLLGWYWKSGFYAGYLLGETFAWPLAHEGFPSALQHPAVSAVAWLAPLATVPALLRPARWGRPAAAVMTGSALIAVVHLETFTDATFLTSLLVGLWLLWFTHRGTRGDADAHVHAIALAQLTVAALFLAPALGKLTGDYTGGEAFYQLYFLDDRWPYGWLRGQVSEDRLRIAATWFSRAAIVGELAIATLPLWPTRWAVAGGVAFMVGMIAVSTLYLLSVLAAPIGLLLAAGLLARSGRDAVPPAAVARARE